MFGSVHWPERLAYLLEGLRQGTHRDMIATAMEKGQPKRRPAGTPIPVLKGMLRVRAEDEAAFLAFCHSAKGAVVRLPPVAGHPGGVNAALRTFFPAGVQKTLRGDAPPSGWVDYDVTLATMRLGGP